MQHISEPLLCHLRVQKRKNKRIKRKESPLVASVSLKNRTWWAESTQVGPEPASNSRKPLKLRMKQCSTPLPPPPPPVSQSVSHSFWLHSLPSFLPSLLPLGVHSHAPHVIPKADNGAERSGKWRRFSCGFLFHVYIMRSYYAPSQRPMHAHALPLCFSVSRTVENGLNHFCSERGGWRGERAGALTRGQMLLLLLLLGIRWPGGWEEKRRRGRKWGSKEFYFIIVLML